ncbi:MAG: HNH endonuclease [Thermodesulfobacteriota bacterium]|nr:HNH endonuclease [Thermodesulfobacteriota bacterium]
MSFPPSIAERALLECGRYCCLCHKFRGFKMELHHIVPKEKGGEDTYENCIPLCLDCHAEVRAYDSKHPKGRKYSPSELRAHRDRWYNMVKKGALVSRETSDGSSTFLPTRKEYNDMVIETIESKPRVFRAILVGPHFLHPQWLIDRRQKIEPRKSFRAALRTYLVESSHDRTRDIRLILRNSEPYPERLKRLLKQHEVYDLIQDMLRNLYSIFFEERPSTISFCCMDPGHYHGVVISEKSCFVYLRETSISRIDGGYELKDPSHVKMEADRFDMTFDANFRGLDEETNILENYIASHKQLI